MTTRLKPGDKEAVERDYRAGLLSLREISQKHGGNPNHVQISRWAKAEGWTRDLNAKIQAKAEALVLNSEGTKASERETIAVAATALAEVKLRHRSDLRTLRDAASGMLQELAGLGAPDLAQWLERMADDEAMDAKERAAARQQVDELLRLHSRIGSAHKLMDIMAKLVATERIVWGIERAEKEGGGDGAGGVQLNEVDRAAKVYALLDLARKRDQASLDSLETVAPD